ncbi:Uncharacterized conserved protein YbjT, contains NAD(P)-binding and DUF2867 domains [Agreia bicolorata]|uniref:Uncharacterized conserved protein YbjT, contains NAD(P)-binding and DUF2867 domains n=1 Tax=Agreia bicolorata TaxID=110935 RepID=A0A1T4Y199_9MICO|nr:SDR family oxidoreductase [Agreia bicolorata]SKA95584.1 Uncharacterized conserved protein YbjT, contains NAD(P)-binding and DUF2867 domains [Agreia bicolorata]
MRIAIAGATGAVGAHVVDVARRRGHDVVALSRSQGVDLLDASAVARALVGAEAVIDVSSIATTSGAASTAFFEASTANLLGSGAAAGVAHHVALSIVNADRAPSGYYAGKVLQERLVSDGPVPWSILRATQFHEFAGQIYDRGRIGPLHAVPIMRTQTVAAAEVAERLVELAESDARGRARDLAGPREERLIDLVRSYASAEGLRGPIVSVPLPGEMGAAMRSGALLPGPEAELSTQTFDEWLRAR